MQTGLPVGSNTYTVSCFLSVNAKVSRSYTYADVTHEQRMESTRHASVSRLLSHHQRSPKNRPQLLSSCEFRGLYYQPRISIGIETKIQNGLIELCPPQYLHLILTIFQFCRPHLFTLSDVSFHGVNCSWRTATTPPATARSPAYSSFCCQFHNDDT